MLFQKDAVQNLQFDLSYYKTTPKVMNLKSDKAGQEVSDKALALLKNHPRLELSVNTVHTALFENQSTLHFHFCKQHNVSGILRIKVSQKTWQVN